MKGYHPYAVREPGTLYDALSRAIDQVGGVKRAADLINRTPGWLDDAANPYREESKRGQVSLAEGAAMSRAGATALAEYLAHCCGGLLLPPIPAAAPGALQVALARTVRENGEAVSEIIQRSADGVIDKSDASAALKEVDEALRAYMTVRAMLVRVIETGEPLR